jgi:hypothetical protein
MTNHRPLVPAEAETQYDSRPNELRPLDSRLRGNERR